MIDDLTRLAAALQEAGHLTRFVRDSREIDHGYVSPATLARWEAACAEVLKLLGEGDDG